jgi:DNA-3-methyladenine glycosylase II
MTQRTGAEKHLVQSDPVLAQLVSAQTEPWPEVPNEDPIWGLIRIVIAQQISTRAACRIAERVRMVHPRITKPGPEMAISASSLRGLGLPERRARCCVDIVEHSNEIRSKVNQGQSWEQALAGIKGIGPWTIAVFRIMVLRDSDVLPLGDVGLERAIANVYGPNQDTEKLAENWRPYRSVACWYLWRTLGNEQLG